MGGKQKRIAEAISMALNAFFIAFCAFAVLIAFKSPSSPLSFLVISAVFGSIVPIAIIVYMARKGVISDIYASERRTRTKPFIGALASYSVGIVALLFFGAPQDLVALMTCYLVNSLVMMTISQVWKISIHASGITGAATFLVHQLGAVMLPFFFLVFPVAWARIKLEAHNLYQVTAGALLAIALTLVQLKLYL